MGIQYLLDGLSVWWIFDVSTGYFKVFLHLWNIISENGTEWIYIPIELNSIKWTIINSQLKLHHLFDCFEILNQTTTPLDVVWNGELPMWTSRNYNWIVIVRVGYTATEFCEHAHKAMQQA